MSLILTGVIHLTKNISAVNNPNLPINGKPQNTFNRNYNYYETIKIGDFITEKFISLRKGSVQFTYNRCI